MEAKPDVIIVGGGFAGITAARDLEKRGVKTVVLEARDRLGGRTYYDERNGYHIELGGTWVHWTQPFIWAEIERYGLKMFETPGCVAETVAMKCEGKVHYLKEEQLPEFVEGFEKFFSEARVVWERPYDSVHTRSHIIARDDISVASRLAAVELTPLQRASVGGMLEILSMHSPEGASYNEMMRCWSLSGWNYPVFNDATARYKFDKGTSSLVDAMVKDGRFEYKLGTKVVTIRHDGDGASVSTSDGNTIEAKAVVVTVPMNILDTVEFEPPISAAKMQFAKEKHAGGGVKIFFEVEGSPDAVLILSSSSDKGLIGSFTYHKAEEGKGNSVLVGFSLDPKALEKPVDEWQTILEEFVPGIKILSTFGHDWGTDPMSLGSWCNFKPGQYTRFAEELPKHEGRVFFASADICEGWRGFIEGAIASGAKAAVAVSDKLSS